MAGYVADYVSDFDKTYRQVRLNSRLVTANGQSSRTSSAFDLPYLPAIFQANTVSIGDVSAYCSLNLKPQAVKLYRDEGDYLYLEHPFQPTTANYQTFMQQLSNNPLILVLDVVGERLTDFYTDLLTQNG